MNHPARGSSVHDTPGRALGIWSFVLAFFVPPLALALGIVGLAQSRSADVRNGLGVAGVVLSAVFIVAASVTTIAIAMGGGFGAL